MDPQFISNERIKYIAHNIRNMKMLTPTMLDEISKFSAYEMMHIMHLFNNALRDYREVMEHLFKDVEN